MASKTLMRLSTFWLFIVAFCPDSRSGEGETVVLSPGTPVIRRVTEVPSGQFFLEGLSRPFEIIAIIYDQVSSRLITQAGPAGAWHMKVAAGYIGGTLRPVAFEVAGNWKEERAVG